MKKYIKIGKWVAVLAVVLVCFSGKQMRAEARIPYGANWENRAGTRGGTTWEELAAYLEGTSYTSYNIIIKGNLTATSSIVLRAPVTIRTDGGNHSISRSYYFSDYFFIVPYGKTLNLMGTAGGLYLYGGNRSGISAGKALIQVSGTLQMFEGVYLANNSNYGYGPDSAWGGGVFVNDYGTMNMYGGRIYNCYASTFGGGIYCDGSLNLYGGSIGIDDWGNAAGNTTRGGGGGVFCAGNCNLYDCNLSYNQADYSGGGYYAARGSTTTMNGGSISYNVVTGASSMVIAGDDEYVANGGGVSLYGRGEFRGGLIFGNRATASQMSNPNETANGRGGGIYVSLSGCLRGGEISIVNNTALRGGGVCVTMDCLRETGNEADLTGTTIAGNTALTGNGGGISCGGDVCLDRSYVRNNSGQGCLVTTEKGTLRFRNSYSTYNTGSGVVLYDRGTFRMESGEISSNNRYGIVVNSQAVLKMSGSAFVGEENSIYLADGRYITVTGPLQRDQAGVISFDENGGYLGRIAAKTTYTSDAFAITKKFRLEKPQKRGRLFLLRPGKDLTPDQRSSHGITTSDLIVSTKYNIRYKVVAEQEKITGKIPPQEKFWGMRIVLTCPIPQVDSSTGIFKGWNEKKDAAGVWRTQGEWYEQNQDYVLYGIFKQKKPEFPERLTLIYEGSGAVTEMGKSQIVIPVMAEQSIIEILKNPFGQNIQEQYYNEVFVRERRIYKNSSFLCWAMKKDGELNWNELYLQETTRTISEIKRNMTTDGRGNWELRLYAVWDAYPEIEASNLSFTLKEAQMGRITRELLEQSAKVRDDREGVRCSICDYQEDEFTGLKEGAEISIRYLAQDKNENKVSKMILVSITDQEKKPVQTVTYQRFISREFYMAGDNTPVLPMDGGLCSSSPWLVKQAYQIQLKRALEEDSRPIEIWRFTNQERMAVQEFSTTYACCTGQGEERVREFYKRFSCCKLSSE
ncbi:MAG: right-handed parallel beta-helix repeat-containing protein [Lachnospiraceae bacterium]